MQFSPCRGGNNCSKEGTHCSGCGRSHEEVRDTRDLVLAIVAYAHRMQYQNPEDFVRYVHDKAVKKLKAC